MKEDVEETESLHKRRGKDPVQALLDEGLALLLRIADFLEKDAEVNDGKKK